VQEEGFDHRAVRGVPDVGKRFGNTGLRRFPLLSDDNICEFSNGRFRHA
jgi:hypothetical protein